MSLARNVHDLAQERGTVPLMQLNRVGGHAVTVNVATARQSSGDRMKWPILRLHEALQSNRRSEPPPAPRRETARQETQLPHRGLALRALRQLARGHYLVVGGETASAFRLAGVPDIVHLAQELIRRGLVERVEVPDCGAACYALSETGLDALRRGERWWRSMSPLERLVVEFTG